MNIYTTGLTSSPHSQNQIWTNLPNRLEILSFRSRFDSVFTGGSRHLAGRRHLPLYLLPVWVSGRLGVRRDQAERSAGGGVRHLRRPPPVKTPSAPGLQRPHLFTPFPACAEGEPASVPPASREKMGFTIVTFLSCWRTILPAIRE